MRTIRGRKAAFHAAACLGWAVLAVMFSAAPTHAARPQVEGDLHQLPAITVTADKRETDAQKTPIALTVITAQELEDAGIRTINDVLLRVPNLGVNPSFGGMSFMSFRGAMTATGTSANPLIIYIDGVPSDTLMNLDANLMDIERVEILRGAQGVVYGKNSLGGIINIISKRPGNEYEGKITTRFGTYDSRSLGATAKGPLVEDRLFFSLSAQHNYSGGWFKSENTSEKNVVERDRAKMQLLFTPTDDAEISFHFDYTKGYDGPTPYLLGNSPSSEGVFSGFDRGSLEILNTALKATLKFDPMVLESISTFRMEDTEWRWYMGYSSPGYGKTGRDETRKEFTQEVRLRSPDDQEGFSWLLGGFFSYADYGIPKMYTTLEPVMGLQPWQNQSFRQFSTEFAPFAQMEVPITEKLKVTGGLRWHHTKRRGLIDTDPNADMRTVMGMMGFPAEEAHAGLEDSWSEWLPRLNVSYAVTDDHMVYAGVSRSFLPGGFNYAAAKEEQNTYDAQTAWNYEVGAKTNWLDNRLSVNVALFYSDFKDMQVMQYDTQINGYKATNAGSAESYGAELDVVYRLMKGLDAEASLGYTHARFKDYEVEAMGGVQNYDGRKVPYTPRYTGNFALQYRHDAGFFARAEAHWFGKLYWGPANEGGRSDVITIDARLGWEFDDFDVYLYGSNIFGERYLNMATDVSNTGIMAPPQEFGMQLTYRF